MEALFSSKPKNLVQTYTASTKTQPLSSNSYTSMLYHYNTTHPLETIFAVSGFISL